MFEGSVSSIPSIWASMNSWLTPTVLFVLLNLMIGTIAITSSLTAQKPHNNQQDHHDHHQQRSSSSSSSSSSQLGRSPSVLQRLRSINFYSYRSQEPTTNFHKYPESETNLALARQYAHEQDQSFGFVGSPSVLQRLKSINLYSYMTSQPEPQLEPKSEPLQQQALKPEASLREEADRADDGGGGDDEQAESLDEIYSKLKGGHVGPSKSADTVPAAVEATAAARQARKMKKSASAKAPASAVRLEEPDEEVEARRPATVREVRASAAAEEDEEVDARADDFINKFKQQLKLQRLDSIIRARK